MRSGVERRSSWGPAVLCVVSVLAALIVQAAPTQLVDGVNIMPTWPLMVIFLWSGARPHYMPPIVIFAIGLTQDLLSGGTMGIWALSYLIAMAAFRYRGEDGMPRDLPPVLARFAGTLAMAHTIAFAAGWFALGQMPDMIPLIIEATATILMFSLLAFLVLRNRRSRGSGFIGG